MVTPYITGAIVIVFLQCVMMMNCVCTLISLTSSVKRPTLVSSSGASTSSRMQNGARLVLEDSNQQRQRGQRLLAAGEQQHVLQLLARRRSHDVDAAFGRVLLVRQPHEGLSAAEELLERELEVLVDDVERLFELLTRDGVDFLDRVLRVLDGIQQVFTLRLEEARGARPFP